MSIEADRRADRAARARPRHRLRRVARLWARRVTQPSFFRRFFGARAGHRGALSRSAVSSARHAIALCHALMSERGEFSGARLAREALAAYQSLQGTAPAIFFDLLVKE